MTSGNAIELTVLCSAIMAPVVWAGWKIYGWEGALRRIARRCDIHDRPAPAAIRRLEAELGMEPSPPTGNFVEDHANPRLIDCGHDWCRARSGR